MEMHSKERDRERRLKNKRQRQWIAEVRARALANLRLAGQRRILRLPDVEVLTSRKRTAIYDDMAAGTFPKPIPLGGRAVGWLEDEIIAWMKARTAERDRRTAA
jgi:prophage regulatory protein